MARFAWKVQRNHLDFRDTWPLHVFRLSPTNPGNGLFIPAFRGNGKYTGAPKARNLEDVP